MAGCFDFMQHVYGLFGFSFKLELSTRPDKRLGDDETWDRAEKVCRSTESSEGDQM
jgi:threonyl-tRNA synthetase